MPKHPMEHIHSELLEVIPALSVLPQSWALPTAHEPHSHMCHESDPQNNSMWPCFPMVQMRKLSSRQGSTHSLTTSSDWGPLLPNRPSGNSEHSFPSAS